MVKDRILYGLLILMLLITAAQRIPWEIWWIRVSDFPHVQLTVITALCLISVIRFTPPRQTFSRILIALGFVAIIYQIYIIFPYTLFASTQVEATDDCQGATISILEANVYQENTAYGEFIQLVKEYSPDIVVGLETGEAWADTLRKSLSEYPHILSEPLNNTYGMILFSKIPLENTQIRYLVEEDIPSFEMEVEVGGRMAKIYVVHPRPPSPMESDSTTQRDAELVLVGREASKSPLPVIVVGDLNDVAWSHTTRLFQRLSGLLDPRKGRGFYNTFNANIALLRYPLDHCFHSDEFMLVHGTG